MPGGFEHRCVFCEQGSDRVPLITVEFRGSVFRICPQHLPVLITRIE